MDVEAVIAQLIGSQVMLLRAIEEQASHRHKIHAVSVFLGSPTWVETTAPHLPKDEDG